MDISALNDKERVALIGLLKMVIQADKKVSTEELEELNRVAEAMGPEAWAAAKAKAMEEFNDLNDVRSYVEEGLDRPEARELIYALVKEMAVVDEEDAMEESVLRWLSRIWNIRQ